VVESETAIIAALNHARSMLICQIDVRVKNFNFFLIMVGALSVALRQWDDSIVRVGLSCGGCLLGVVFFLLDARTLLLIKDSRNELYRLEPEFGMSIHQADRIADRPRGIASSGRSRIISHTFCYRLVFVLATFGFVITGLRSLRLF